MNIHSEALHAIENPLVSKAMLATVKIRQWSGRKLDKQVTADTNRAHNADSDAGRFNKALVSKSAMASIGERASIGEGDKCERPIYIVPLPFGLTNYYITATKTNIAIGCELHPIEWWDSATDKDIIALEGKKALKYWKVAKPIIFALLEGVGYWKAK